MKKVININFQGVVVPIEETAYDILQDYTNSLKNYFAEEEGKDEIINDIESRISELFQQRLKNGATCITDDDVNAIINNMGRPADFDQAEGEPKDSKESTSTSPQQQSQWNSGGKRLYRDETNKILGGVCSGIGVYLGVDAWLVRLLFIISGIGFIAYLVLWIFLPVNSNLTMGTPHKRLYRNPDDKMIGGVCGGIGSYFDINPWIPRIIFLLPFITFIFRWHNFAGLTFPNFVSFTFSPGTFLLYIILWLVIPEAKTTSEKLEMKGEKVDLNSIKESVVKEMKGVSDRMNKLGKEAGEFMKDRGPELRKDFGHAVNRGGAAIGNIITLLIKIVLYIILACVAFAVIVAVFSVAFVAIGIFPLKSYVITDGWQNVMAWGTLIFFIGVPVVGIITYIIRKIARMKSNNAIRYSFIGLWILGWICLFSLISLVGRDFKSTSTIYEESIALTNPEVAYMEIKPIQTKDFRWRGWFRFEPYSEFGISEDTALIGNVRLRIVQSPNDSFQIRYVKMSNGPTRREADRLASKINFNGYQTDSTLYLDNSISINKTDKLRNQIVEVSIGVPVGHRIKINKSFGYRNRVKLGIVDYDDRNWGRMESDYDFMLGEEYIMKEDGLHSVDGDDNDEGNDGSNYRYKGPLKVDSLKQEQQLQIEKMEKAIDSTKEAHKKEMEKIQDSLLKQRKEIDKKLENIKGQTAEIKYDLPEIKKSPIPFISFI